MAEPAAGASGAGSGGYRVMMSREFLNSKKIQLIYHSKFVVNTSAKEQDSKFGNPDQIYFLYQILLHMNRFWEKLEL